MYCGCCAGLAWLAVAAVKRRLSNGLVSCSMASMPALLVVELLRLPALPRSRAAVELLIAVSTVQKSAGALQPQATRVTAPLRCLPRLRRSTGVHVTCMGSLSTWCSAGCA